MLWKNQTLKRKDEAWQKLKQLRQAEKDLKESNEATTAQLNRANNAIQKQVEKHKELVAKYKEEESQVKKLRQENRELLSSHEKVTKNYQTSNKELKETGEEFKQLNTTINYPINLEQSATKWKVQVKQWV